MWIKSVIRRDDAEPRALDMAGTGLLQAIQILAYVSNYNPKILLLDEPDAHLHPSNQRLLSHTLDVISKQTDTKIILATHSRHLLDSLSESEAAKLFWIKSGIATQQDNWSDIAVLMDLGALDKGEQFLNGSYKYLVWTEDTDTKPLEVLLVANGIPSDQTLIFSYQASSKVDAAKLMASFTERVRPGVITVVHRDRDFMDDSEVTRLLSKYNLDSQKNIRMLITERSDIEAYFTDPKHLSIATGKDEQEVRDLIDDILHDNMVEFVLLFQNKREEIKRDLYKKDPNNCPSPSSLISGSRVPVEKTVGKKLLKLIRNRLQSEGLNGGDIITETMALKREEIARIFN
ncbi:AAA family ATPase [Gluconobacter oxydans]|uniref:AAA family ATPase n=1 Tax=Gluconobacter oxydans TaxID=442 RepID=UPI0009C0D833|nr:AAA family ATPase [Gluconobacter oxydans]